MRKTTSHHCYNSCTRDEGEVFNGIGRRIAQRLKQAIGDQEAERHAERSPADATLRLRLIAQEGAVDSGIFPAPNLTACPSGCSYSHAARLAVVLGHRLALANRAIVRDRLIAVLHQGFHDLAGIVFRELPPHHFLRVGHQIALRKAERVVGLSDILP